MSNYEMLGGDEEERKMAMKARDEKMVLRNSSVHWRVFQAEGKMSEFEIRGKIPLISQPHASNPSSASSPSSRLPPYVFSTPTVWLSESYLLAFSQPFPAASTVQLESPLNCLLPVHVPTASSISLLWEGFPGASSLYWCVSFLDVPLSSMGLI